MGKEARQERDPPIKRFHTWVGRAKTWSGNSEKPGRNLRKRFITGNFSQHGQEILNL
jgi:hypothetical protein